MNFDTNTKELIGYGCLILLAWYVIFAFNDRPNILVIDGCEYVSVHMGGEIAHKGNCTNVIHKMVIENK